MHFLYETYTMIENIEKRVEGMAVIAKKVITIALIDDHKLFREGVKRILSFEPTFDVVAEADDGSEAKRIVEEYKIGRASCRERGMIWGQGGGGQVEGCVGIGSRVV